ncbi:hypothetical protein T439DRAFT_325538 [Meredithblackwellia eburnea MCA 4105]
MASQRDKIWLFGYPITHSASPAFQNSIYEAVDLPHRYRLHDTEHPTKSDMLTLIRASDFAGAAVTMPIKVVAMEYVDKLEPEAKEIGSINTIIVRKDEVTGKEVVVGQNYDWEGIRGAIRESLPVELRKEEAPFGKGKCSYIIGGGGTTRAAVYALSRMSLSPIFLINRDPTETADIIKSFPQYDLRPLNSADDWTDEWADKVACGVGAIPSFEPVTDGEKNVYKIAAKVFEGRNEGKRARQFLEMCYKPRVTILYKMAEAQGWTVVPGIEAMVEQGLAQQRAWLFDSLAAPPPEKTPSPEALASAVEKAREDVRGMADIKSAPAKA